MTFHLRRRGVETVALFHGDLFEAGDDFHVGIEFDTIDRMVLPACDAIHSRSMLDEIVEDLSFLFGGYLLQDVESSLCQGYSCQEGVASPV